MSDLSLLSGEERKSHFKAVTSVDHPIQKSALSASLPVGGRNGYYAPRSRRFRTCARQSDAKA